MYCSLIYLSAWWLTDLGKGHIWHYFRNSYMLDMQIQYDSLALYIFPKPLPLDPTAWSFTPDHQCRLVLPESPWCQCYGNCRFMITPLVSTGCRSIEATSLQVMCNRLRFFSSESIALLYWHPRESFLHHIWPKSHSQNSAQSCLWMPFFISFPNMFYIFSIFPCISLATYFCCRQCLSFSTHNWIKIVASCCYSSHF